MIEITGGNLLEADAEALVNTVNCVGQMGKGIALQFKQAFPVNCKLYEAACKRGEVVPGKMFIYDNGGIANPRFIINFPTKRHWRGNSRLEDVAAGLKALVEDVRRLEIHSIAVPPLGCGLGGLDWQIVRPMIEQAFAPLPDVRVLLFEPSGAPAAKAMPVRTERPKLTQARALFLKLIAEYQPLDGGLSLLEVQKLAYFLQAAGEPLRLNYEAGHYGPYAANLNKVLQTLEGHFIRGFGDSPKPDRTIELLGDARAQAEEWLQQADHSLARIERVAELVEGFETPYGMELLSTVHWVAHRGGPKANAPASNPEEAYAQICDWNRRKENLFIREHIGVAWGWLGEMGWMN